MNFLLGMAHYAVAGGVFAVALDALVPDLPFSVGIAVVAAYWFLWSVERFQRRKDDRRWMDAVDATRRWRGE